MLNQIFIDIYSAKTRVEQLQNVHVTTVHAADTSHSTQFTSNDNNFYLSEHHDVEPDAKGLVQRSLLHSVHRVVLCIPATLNGKKASLESLKCLEFLYISLVTLVYS